MEADDLNRILANPIARGCLGIVDDRDKYDWVGDRLHSFRSRANLAAYLQNWLDGIWPGWDDEGDRGE